MDNYDPRSSLYSMVFMIVQHGGVSPARTSGGWLQAAAAIRGPAPRAPQHRREFLCGVDPVIILGWFSFGKDAPDGDFFGARKWLISEGIGECAIEFSMFFFLCARLAGV